MQTIFLYCLFIVISKSWPFWVVPTLKALASIFYSVNTIETELQQNTLNELIESMCHGVNQDVFLSIFTVYNKLALQNHSNTGNNLYNFNCSTFNQLMMAQIEVDTITMLLPLPVECPWEIFGTFYQESLKVGTVLPVTRT